MSYIPYEPCNECKQKGKLCNQCALTNLKLNYHRALEEIMQLRTEQEKSIIILV